MIYENGFTQIELDRFSAIKNCRVVFDIGAKDNIEYLEAKPKATYHLFEPIQIHFEDLTQKVIKGGWKKVYLNNFGIGEDDGVLGFNSSSESFDGSGATPKGGGGIMLPIRSLDGYIEEHKIKRIDFIKMDTEGFEYKIIKGNPKAIGMTRYLQVEYWDNEPQIREILSGQFLIEDIGCRNLFCTKK